MEVVDRETMQYARLLRPAIIMAYEQGKQNTLNTYEAILKNAKPQHVKIYKKALHYLWDNDLLAVDPRPVFKGIRI